MKITKIKYDDNKNLFQLSIEKEILYISYEIYEKYKIKDDIEIDMELYRNLLIENNYQLAKRKIEKFINYKTRTKYEVKKRLYNETKDDEAIEKIIDYYEKLGILDDEKYAQEYINYLLNIKSQSLKYTKNKLVEKGIDKSIYEKYINNYDIEKIEYDNAMNILKKKYKNLDLDNEKNKQKIYRYFASKGFSYNIIKRVLNND